MKIVGQIARFQRNRAPLHLQMQTGADYTKELSDNSTNNCYEIAGHIARFQRNRAPLHLQMQTGVDNTKELLDNSTNNCYENCWADCEGSTKPSSITSSNANWCG